MDPRYERTLGRSCRLTGLINQELLLKNEYFAAEKRILRAHLTARLRLSDPKRSRLAKIGKRLGRKALALGGIWKYYRYADVFGPNGDRNDRAKDPLRISPSGAEGKRNAGRVPVLRSLSMATEQIVQI